MASVAEHDDLTEHDLRQRFTDRVLPYLFGNHRPSTVPTLVLVGGQPAAGKSISIARLAHRNRSSDLVILTGDALRQFHPHVRRMLATDPIAMPNATAAAAASWVRMSIDYAYTHRFSLLLEGTFRDATAVTDTVRRFAAAAYDTHVVVLAVRPERSRLDSMLRYQLATGGEPGRREWLAQYRTLLDKVHQRRRIDPRELSTYLRLHADAVTVLTMAFHDRGDPQYRHQLARRDADRILLDELAHPAASALHSRTRRGFAPLAEARPAPAPQPTHQPAPRRPATPPKYR